MLLDQTLAGYQEIDRLSREIEQALQAENFDLLAPLLERMNILQEAVKHQDTEMLDLVRSRQPETDDEYEQINALVRLMQTIINRNQRLLPRVHAIMAVKRDDMRKLSTGNALLKTYQNMPRQSGGRISSSN
ncbi:hypothetical protein [Desulfobulbus alkaliphilus]|uniref:hypothetical protein n=1 Tax=Desulfobulbus alkaliphilus TaxID=869814 RepID=UPI001962FF43|nr:hypothetical protein [Desulfobulbus alkaliphilus]MBM9537393.1 hypothetical protein [Desulfobulbus alkaliphilus]